MSTPTKKPSFDKQQDKSDVLSLLLSIESMFVACQNVLNSYTQTTLMLSISLETQMLLMKLRVMKDRWSVHLPFKEACTIDFYDWGKKVKTMSQKLGMIDNDEDSSEPLTEYCPSKHFMLDLYEMLPESASASGSPAHYRETNIPRFIADEEKIRRQISRNWDSYKRMLSDVVAEKVGERIGNVLEPVVEQNVQIKVVCAEVLQQLSVELYQLDEMSYRTISRDMFARLAERVTEEQEYGGRKAQSSARHYVEDIKNKTPDQDWERLREEEIKMSIEIIGEMKYGRRMFDHLGRDCNIKGNHHKLGKCLYSIRKDIEKQELYDLIEQLYRIEFLREDKEQQEAARAEAVMATATNSKDAQAVYEKRRVSAPQRPRLPLFFMPCLLDSESATRKFYDVLHHCGFYIGRTLLEHEKRDKEIRIYESWKWKHLREAFIKLGFIKADSTKKGFAEFLESVFPYLTSDNVKRGFNSRGGYEDKDAFNRIVVDIMVEFQPVKDMCQKVNR